jgi:hypothetical protein
MLPMLNARQIRILFDTAAGAPEPATAQALRERAELRQLGLLAFDEGGRFTVSPQGQTRLRQYAQATHRRPAPLPQEPSCAAALE